MDLTKHTPGYVPLRVKARRAVWNTACFFLFRPFPTQLFHFWRIALLKAFGAKVEWDANVYSSAKIWAPWNLEMGHRACLGPEVIFLPLNKMVLKDDVIVVIYILHNRLINMLYEYTFFDGDVS